MRILGTAEQNVEKEFWVCWTLNTPFNRLPDGGPRLLFKGGTSLSKVFGLISCFSEDIDVTVFRDDLGEGASVELLETMSGKKRKEKLEAIQDACQAYIAGPLLTQLARLLTASLANASIATAGARVELDDDDDGRQALLLWCPSVTAATDGYVRPAVKFESGAKSALDPHRPVRITPYVAAEVDGIELAVASVTTVDAERTFWDKVVTLHGLSRWFERRGGRGSRPRLRATRPHVLQQPRPRPRNGRAGVIRAAPDERTAGPFAAGLHRHDRHDLRRRSRVRSGHYEHRRT